MKIIFHILVIWFSFKFLFTAKPVDYRDSYCGSYSCKRIHKYLRSNTIYLDTTNFTVIISKNAVDSMINIETSEDTYTGKLANSKVIGKNYHAIFSNDSLYFTFIPGLGPKSYRYLGKK